MSVTKDEVKKIAELARLEFKEDEIKNFTDEMNKILTYVEKLNELDTSNVEPLSHPIENTNVFREDKIHQSTPTEDALKNAPDSTSEHFKVPKVINNK
ncbi:MAG: Asp-tRNA(Asn)/Glu-tRNA(Gln) amidotransferase GatCAB subunit C [Ignavibacteriae bacterium]|nr:MAG: Asp-tRNA(Asn)/Glu-tRNA(Gln) amidotransferase GatCAB subunit C [Ignavibacteriota bacterium]